MADGSDRILKGRCLCAGVQFEIERAAGPFELCHCSRCRKVSGSAFMAGLGVCAADPPPGADWFEIPAGRFDDSAKEDPQVRPDKHIFVDRKSAWHTITDALLQLTKAQLIEHRSRARRLRP